MNKDVIFTKEQNDIWSKLYENQIKNVQKFASREFIDGFNILNLPTDKIPSLNFVNQEITKRTGWRATRTKIRYSGALPWYQHFAKKEFIVTNYLRSWKEFDFTPEPDMFHDIFGHLSFLTNPKYVELFTMFSEAYLKANKTEQVQIGRLAWFSYEFGLINENGNLKVFGAGIMSSIGEMKKVMTGGTKLEKFTIKSVLKSEKAIANFNDKLFIFDSLEDLKAELKTFLDPIRFRKKKIVVSKTIVDKEMDLTKY